MPLPQPPTTTSTLTAGVCATLLSLFLFIQVAVATVVDRVVAVVNDEVITLSELEEEAASLYSAIARSTSDTPLLTALAEAREQALENMIEQRLVSQRAKEMNVSASDEEVDAAYERMRANTGLAAVEFRDRLILSGLSDKSYRQRLRLQILQGKLVNQDIRSRIAISEEMLQEYYTDHYLTSTRPEQLYLLQMGFSWPATAEGLAREKQEARQRAERVQRMVRDGGDFKALAKDYSELPSADDGGDIGLFRLDEMAPAMRAALSPLQPGELSAIIETPAGYQFFQVLADEEGERVASAPFEAVKEEIKSRLHEQKLTEAYAEWFEKLKENAYIQKL